MAPRLPDQDGCTSFDIALEVGKKIKSLQVVNCQTSSEKDKQLACKQDLTKLLVAGLHPWNPFSGLNIMHLCKALGIQVPDQKVRLGPPGACINSLQSPCSLRRYDWIPIGKVIFRPSYPSVYNRCLSFITSNTGLHHVHLRRLVLLDPVRKDIFDYIVSELGSLERMDEQIRSLIGKMLKKNLTNVGHATDSLLHELGQI